MRRLLSTMFGVALLGLAACGSNEVVSLEGGTGKLDVTVSQALHEVSPATIDRVVVKLYSGVWPTSLLQGTYELGYNGAEWTSVLDGIPAGTVTIIAQVFAGGHPEPVFVSDPAAVTIEVGNTASTRIVLNQVELQEGIHAPVIDWLTTSATSVRPGEAVTIQVGFTEPDGEDVTVAGTSDDAGGSFSPAVTVPVDAMKKGQATIIWTAPTTESGLLPEEIELEVTDPSGAVVRLQLFFRVIWNEQELEVDFELNLAPVVTSLRVAPANPVDGQGSPLLLGASLGSLEIGFSAYDPDASGGEQLRYEWTIPEDCGDPWKWYEIFGIPVAPRWIDAEGNLGTGTGTKSKDHFLAYPFNPSASCTLTLTVTDGQGAMTMSTLVIKPFDVVTHYTPTIEISFQNGFEAVPGYEIDFGIMSFVRLYADFVAAPNLAWKLGNLDWQAATAMQVPNAGPELAYASTFRWNVGTDGVSCDGNAVDGYSVDVQARACNPLQPADVPVNLCNLVSFTVEVPTAEAAAVCSNVAAP